MPNLSRKQEVDRRYEVGKKTAARRMLNELYARSGDESLHDWGAKYFPDFLSKPPSRLHKHIGEVAIELSEKRGQRVNVIAPRESAKSTTITFLYAMWAICHGTEKFIVLMSDTAGQAKSYLADIKRSLEDNEELEKDYPEACGRGEVWNTGEVRTRNGIFLRAAGAETGIRGVRKGANRPSLIVVDDPEGDDGARSDNVRGKVRETFFKSTLKLGNRDTNVFVIGTVMHRECLVGHIRDKLPGWRKIEYKALIEWPSKMHLWSEWAALFGNLFDPDAEQKADEFLRSNYDAMHEGADVLWPENESLVDLMRMREMEGHASFESEKQNNPINPDECEWPSSYFDEAPRFDAWPVESKIKVVSLDPSKGKSDKRGDYSVFCLLQITPDGQQYREYDVKRRPVESICDDAISIIRRFEPQFLAIEANQFQEMLADRLYAEIKKHNLNVSVVPLENTISKIVRIRTEGSDLEHGRISFRQTPETELALNQYRDFPLASHDDAPDAGEMARRVAYQKMQPVRMKKSKSRRETARAPRGIWET